MLDVMPTPPVKCYTNRQPHVRCDTYPQAMLDVMPTAMLDVIPTRRVRYYTNPPC